MTPRTSLEDLPNELLDDIISRLPDLGSTPKKSGSLYALSQVSKHFRDLSLPFLFRELALSEGHMWEPALNYFTTEGKQNAPYVRTIRFLTYRRFIYTRFVPFIAIGPQARGPLVFPNLQSFECFGGLPGSTRRLTVDLPNKELRHLTLQCHSRLFPRAVEHLPQLKSLHILLLSSHIDDCVCPNCLTPSTSLFSGPYNSISRLLIEANEWATWPTSIWKSLQFPNLKVFSCRDLGDDCVYPIYAFIQRHSTLLQVNVAFENKDLRLEGLIKLIEGTGKWEAPEGVEITPQLFIQGVLDAAEPVAFENDFLDFPDDIPGPRIIFPAFGFIREPIRTERPPPRGGLMPQYKTTALALQLSQSTEDCPQFRVDIDKVIFLSSEYSMFPDVEELRLESRTTWSNDFDTWTDLIAIHLRRWKRLRKFSFGCALPDDWAWKPDGALSACPILDEVFPPADFSRNTRGIGMTLARVRALEGDLVVDHIEDHIQSEFPGIPPLDENDSLILTRCWRDLHHDQVKETVSLFSKSCPSLEEVDWYLPGRSDEYGECDGYSVWKWKIRPGSPKIIVGDFIYYDRRLKHRLFDTLVGEELEYVQHLRERGLY